MKKFIIKPSKGTPSTYVNVEIPNNNDGGLNVEINSLRQAEPHEIPNKSLVGRYLKVLEDAPKATNFKKGDYIKIASEEYGTYEVRLEGSLKYGADPSKKDLWELMPEGFEPDNDIIPEYVECIKTCYGKNIQSQIGKIYKTSLNPEFSVHSWEEIYHSKIIPNYFKPSTKEAYEAQFISKEEFILPEKWCINTTKENIKYLNEYLKYNSHKYNGYKSRWIVSAGNFFYSETPYSGAVCHSSFCIKHGFKEITFEQFKEHVFKNMYSNWAFVTKNGNVVYDKSNLEKKIYVYTEESGKKSEYELNFTIEEPRLYVKTKQKLLNTENFETNELSLPTLIKPKKSLLINH